ncbi:MAG: hypothetical protein GY844_19850 [Bradyrhizobium sp.]|nr:hypothetical protein [Bradyrhizobium sp.]
MPSALPGIAARRRKFQRALRVGKISGLAIIAKNAWPAPTGGGPFPWLDAGARLVSIRRSRRFMLAAIRLRIGNARCVEASCLAGE